MAASLQVIDFGLAAFDPRLAAAAGGYESEVCTAVLLLQPGGLCSSAGQLGKVCNGQRWRRLLGRTWWWKVVLLAVLGVCACSSGLKGLLTSAVLLCVRVCVCVCAVVQDVMQHLNTVFAARHITFGTDKVSSSSYAAQPNSCKLCFPPPLCVRLYSTVA
jgi:hypothetical protein